MASPGQKHESEVGEFKTETPYAPLDNEDCSPLPTASQSVDQRLVSLFLFWESEICTDMLVIVAELALL